MRNKYKTGIAFLLIIFMALIYSPMAAFAANGLVIDNQSCSAAGGQVIFAISINNAPNDVSAFGLTVTYDENILEFVKFNGGDLPAFMVSANKNKTLPTLTIGGYYTGSEDVGLAKGASGKIGELVFKVKSCELLTLGISNLTDGIRTWPTEGGQLIAPVLHPPVLQEIGNKTVMLGGSVSFTAQATDADGDAIIYSISGSPDGAYFGTQNGEFDWTPNQGQSGTYPLTVTATDSTGKSDSKTIQITVTEPHAPVVAAIADQTVMAGSTLSITAQAMDADGDAITYSISNAPAGATFNKQTGNLIWTPTQGEAGSYSVTITATDTTGRSSSATFPIAVASASLTMNNQSCTGLSGEEVTFTVSVNSTPADASTLGLEVSYDESILEYKNFSRGDLTQGFMLLDVSKLVSKPNTLRFAGLGGSSVIVKGSSGSIVNLIFTVKNCGPVTVDMANLDADIEGWSVKPGLLSEVPTITSPGDIVVEADEANGTSTDNTAIQAFLNGAAARDAMNNPLKVTSNAPAVFSFGSTVVTFTAVDGAGNSVTCKATVSVVDTTPPAITCPAGITVDAEGANGTSASNFAIQAFLNGAAASDAAGIAGITTNAPATFPMGTTQVTFTAKDGSGMTSSCTSTVTIADTTAPVITCPDSITVDAEGASGTSASNFAIQAFLNGATASDAAGIAGITTNAPATFPMGTMQVTFTAKDGSGMTSSCTSTVTIVDITAPVITCPGNITVAAESANGTSAGNAAIQAFLKGAAATDLISGVVSVTNNAPAVFPLGKTEVTFSTADNSGNPNSCTASVTVVDKVPPDITCPADITVTAEGPNGVSASNASIQAFLNGATASDAIDGVVSVTNNAPSVFPLGKTEVTFSATDNTGNPNTRKASVTVVDKVPPVITCPANITLTAAGPNGVSASNSAIQAFLNGATAADDVDGSVSVTNNAPASFGLGKTEVTFSATDKAGNPSSCTATVTVADNTPPTINCPTNIRVEAQGPNGVSANISAIQTFLNSATAYDAEDGPVNVTNNAPATFAFGNNTVTFSTTDSAGNPASCMATVTVVDETDPDITCPVSISIAAEGSDGVYASNSAIQAFLKAATASDNIGPVSISNDAPALFAIGSRNVTFIASDEAGNIDSCTATVTVTDSTKPDITCPESITVDAEGANGASAGNSAIQAFLNGARATDAIDGPVSVSNNAPAVFGFGKTEVAFAATDQAFNTSSCSASVTVTDQTGPAITCPANISVAADGTNGTPASNAAIQAFLHGVTATDKVDGSVTVINDAPAVFGVGNTVVTFSAKDKAGNPASCEATVTVGDQVGPVITCPSDITVSSTSDGVLATASKIKTFLSAVNAVDAIDGSLTVTNDAPAKFNVGNTVVTFSATDKSGNTNFCKATVTIKIQSAGSTGSLFGSSPIGGSFTGSSYGGSLYGNSTYGSGFNNTLTPYVPSSNLYQPFNQNLFNYQAQSWNLYQPTSAWSTLSWTPTWSLF
jgi:hypothetical protein